MRDDYETRLDEHRRGVRRRLAALRAANLVHGRDYLRRLRRATRPRVSPPERRRRPALVLAVLFVVVLLAFVLVERADGSTLGGIAACLPSVAAGSRSPSP
jgi:hypothetical protein